MRMNNAVVVVKSLFQEAHLGAVAVGCADRAARLNMWV